MKRGLRESDIENHLKLEATKRGAKAYKFVSPGQRDVPDRLIAYRGQLTLCEVKKPGEKPRPGQVRCHEELRERGIKVFVVDTKEGVDAMYDAIERRGK